MPLMIMNSIKCAIYSRVATYLLHSSLSAASIEANTVYTSKHGNTSLMPDIHVRTQIGLAEL